MVAQKIVISFWLLVISLFITPFTTFAQTATPSTLPTTVSPTSPLYTDLLVHNMFHTFSCLAVGQSVIGQPCLNYVQGVPVLSQVNLSGGTLGAVTGLIGLLYQHPPVRTSESLASLSKTFGLAKETHAQVGGSGAEVLRPIESLWQVSRNISYLIMIVIFVVIGVMIIFRQRINPQTVITAQAALPGLVIGLILITFSYFLAGLISDTAFLGTNLVGAYFSAVKGQPAENLVEKISAESAISIFSRFTDIINKDNAADALASIWDHLGEGARNLLRVVAGAVMFQYTFQASSVALAIPAVGQGIQAGLATLSGLAAAGNPTATVGLVLSFVATAILIYTIFKLLLRLVNNFLSIIFLTVTAPFHFLFASLPGRQGLATNWFLNMLSNVLAFPAVLAVFYFVAFLLGRDFGPLTVSDSNGMNNFTTTVYAQERIRIVDSATFPLMGGIDLEFIKILLAFGALVATPAIPDVIAKTIGRVTQAGQIIGQEVTGDIRAGRGYVGQFQQGIGAAGERAGGLYTKRGLQEFYDANRQKMVQQETRTPGGIELIKRRAGAFRGWIKGNRPPRIDSNAMSKSSLFWNLP